MRTKACYSPVARATAFLMAWLICTPLYASPGNSSADDQALGSLKADLRAAVTTRGSWSLMKGLVYGQLNTYARNPNSVDGRGLTILTRGQGFSELSDPLKALAFIERLRQKAIENTTAALVNSGLPVNVAKTISERISRQYLFQLQKAVLTYSAPPKNISAKVFGAAVTGVLRQSSAPLLLKPDISSRELQPIAAMIQGKFSERVSNSDLKYLPARFNQASAAEAEENLSRLFNKATAQIRLTEMPDVVVEMRKFLKKEATDKLDSLTDLSEREHFLDALAQDFIARAGGVTVAANRTILNVTDGFQAMKTIGQFQALQRNTIDQVYRAGENIHAGLDAAANLLSGSWQDQRDVALQITGSTTSLPPSALTVANTVHLINDLSALTSGGNIKPSTVDELANLIPENSPQAKQVFRLAEGLSQIGNSQASFAQQGQVLLGTLASITKSPQLEQVQSAFNSVAPLLQSAGPLLALAGFATPFGGIAAVGGLLGGGGGMFGGGDSGTAAALAAINQKLAEIDHKLDIVIGKLDALDRKITEEHIEVMNALESISFDVNRTRDLILLKDVQEFSSDCEDIPATIDDARLSMESKQNKFVSCNLALNRLNSSATKGFLKAIPNLSTDTLHKNAYLKLQALASVYGRTEKSAKDNCFSLTIAAYSVHDIDNISGMGQSQAQPGIQAAMCSDILSFSNMLDSGMLTFFSHLEWTFADRSTSLGDEYTAASIWNKASRGDVIHRWKNELRLLNIAIGQQARLTGDVTTPEWARDLDLQTALAPTEQQTLDQSEILAQNSLRYWLKTHRTETQKHDAESTKSTSTIISFPLQYAFAFNACAPDYLQSLTNFGPVGETDFKKTTFRWTMDVLDQTSDPKSLIVDGENSKPKPCPTKENKSDRWCALFDGLKNCIVLPTPSEMITGELRKADNLEALIESRQLISNLIETTQLIESLQDNDRLLLLEALATQWAYEKRIVQGAPAEGTVQASSPYLKSLGSWPQSASMSDTRQAVDFLIGLR